MGGERRGAGWGIRAIGNTTRNINVHAVLPLNHLTTRFPYLRVLYNEDRGDGCTYSSIARNKEKKVGIKQESNVHAVG